MGRKVKRALLEEGHRVTLPPRHHCVRNQFGLVMLTDDAYDWLVANVGENDSDWDYDQCEKTQQLIFHFRDLSHALLFKLTWGGT